MAYSDDGEYTPDADVAGMYEPTPDVPFMGNYGGAEDAASSIGWLDTVLSEATAVIAPGYQQYDDQMRSVDTVAREAGGVAATLGSNWITETLGGAAKWYEKQDKETKGTLLSLAGSFVKGAFSHKNEERKLKSSEKMADATMLNAQTNADSTAKKFTNASSIGGTNFGAPTGLMTYSDKLAPRRARNQYKV